MTIDTDELKLRIARQREGMLDAARPRAAEALSEDIASTLSPAKAGALSGLYAIPVLGYCVRIAASVFNLPQIVANLQRHYSGYHAEIRRLNLQVVELRHEAQLAERAIADASARIAQLQRRLGALESGQETGGMAGQDGGER